MAYMTYVYRIPKYLAYGTVALAAYGYMSNNAAAFKYVYMPLVSWLDPERSHRLAIKLAAWNFTPKEYDEINPTLVRTLYECDCVIIELWTSAIKWMLSWGLFPCGHAHTMFVLGMGL